ncbi:unnamed protein product [Didymodactylos carnosus]|uniref:Uncharacterized protein n=1 Tax=Didymodactylos carnosus TaxID=1234261 RepID=A0A814B6X3_9BILA|nr:unnamed protein product [Didymodactylos carnosus]CAF1046995.1 unnamed protein product [Didymodactylos carnosus]CAF3703106.1 unnamed protein product [Didymodactylos carnosus]CAF3814879.1 unnamed protein product [Didymodactylos carnosus]
MDKQYLNVAARRSLPSSSTGAKPSVGTQQQQSTLPNSSSQDLFNYPKRWVLFFCHRFIFAEADLKIIFYFCLLLVGSTIKGFDIAPQTFLSDKRNTLNTYFAKLGWGWTMGLLLPFVCLTNFDYTTRKYEFILKHLIRLLIATGIWYGITSLFQYIESLTGHCEHLEYSKASRQICLKGGHKWEEGYDLSGHTFLLMYSLLVINEEVKSYETWKKSELSYKENSEEKSELKSKQQRNDGDAQSSSSAPVNYIDWFGFYKLSLAIKCLYTVLALLTVLWEIMLLSTALYFHLMLHKFFAAVLAVLMWFITYRYWYKYRSDPSNIFIPCLPGDGL